MVQFNASNKVTAVVDGWTDPSWPTPAPCQGFAPIGITVHGGSGANSINVSAIVYSSPFMMCPVPAISINGAAGDDTIIGSGFPDNLSGGDGADSIQGRDWADTIYGGLGNDTVDGGAGTDRVYGEAGNDVLSGGADADCVYGGLGDDTLWSGSGAASGPEGLYGEDGCDQIDGMPESGCGTPPGTPTVQFTTGSQSGSEAVGTMTITAQLSAVSSANVTVPFTWAHDALCADG